VHILGASASERWEWKSEQDSKKFFS